MSSLPMRLICQRDGNLSIFDPRTYNVPHFDIVSYTWGPEVAPYRCGIPGVEWDVKINPAKIEDLRRLMVAYSIEYMWADCVCINQTDNAEKAVEIAKMFQYYKTAQRCHILIEMDDVWNPQEIVDDLKFLDHVLYHMQGAALASEAPGLTGNATTRLVAWGTSRPWAFGLDQPTVRSAAVDMGVLNCYATCIGRVTSLFENPYFSRVWTFQEMILGKNITMWGMNKEAISYIGELRTWMDLATDANDRALKLRKWISGDRFLNTATINTILRVIAEDIVLLSTLQVQVEGIDSAKTDIINGGASWWRENYKGISNIFSAISIRPRMCRDKADIFRGLLGIFSGLFTPEEIDQDMSGDDLDSISFKFFQRLSLRTERAWTKLSITSRERGAEWNWIPIAENSDGAMTTDVFASVLNLGYLKKKEGYAKAAATTGLLGSPRKYMKIRISQGSGEFQFVFRGCNCGKKVKTGMFKTEKIPTYDQPQNVASDETGRILVQCSTVLGALIDPGCADLIAYRRSLLEKLLPMWRISDPNAKPIEWIDRSVSGSFWENPHQVDFRVHNLSMNFRMVDVTGCESRLANGSTASIMCEVTANCGCVVVAPFAFIFEAISAVPGSSLGNTAAFLDSDGRIMLQDGLGLVQVSDVGKTFNLVAFGGEIRALTSYSTQCRKTKTHQIVQAMKPWPSSRALVREEFSHDAGDMMRDYGYVDTEGSGNLLICRKHPMDPYKIVGVCVDKMMDNKKGVSHVTIR